MSETIKAVLSVISVGGALWVLFMIFRGKSRSLESAPTKKLQDIKIDFDSRRMSEAKRIDALEKQDLLVELNRSRSERDK